MSAALREQAAGAYFGGILFAYALVILLSHQPPPFVDYPDWVYQGALFHDVLSGHPVAGYALKHYPVPNSLTTAGLGVLGLAMPWDWAGKVWICLYLALAAFASWTLARALKVADWRLMLALPAIVFLNLNFWYGHIGFEVGMCFVLLLLAMLLRGAPARSIGAMLVLIFFTHMEACGAALLLLLVWSTRSRSWRLAAATIPTLALTAWYALARFSTGNRDGRALLQADYRYGSSDFLVYKANTFFKTFAYVNARTLGGLSVSESIFGRTLFCVLIAASLALAGLGLYAIVRGAWKAGGALRLLLFMLLGIALVLPQVWLGVADPGTRLLLIAIAAGLFLVDWKRPEGAAIAWLSVLFCVVNLWQFARVERDPAMAGHVRDLPDAALVYGHVEPATRLQMYDKLREGRMDVSVFETGLFVDVAK